MSKAYPLNPTFKEENTVNTNVKKLDLVNLSMTTGTGVGSPCLCGSNTFTEDNRLSYGECLMKTNHFNKVSLLARILHYG